MAIGDNPYAFNGVNYVEKLEGFYTSNQLGDTASMNDDYFGLLALIAANTTSAQIKQDTLAYIIAHQAPSGGFSWSSDITCQYCEESSDMTAAAIQALQAAKNNGVSNSGLEDAITKAKNYLLSHQNSDGGFGTFGSDADTTGWALMALNAMGMKDGGEAQKAKAWLLTTQGSDGGFVSWGVADSTTTAHGLIALSGNTWLLRIYTPISTSTSTPTIIPTATPTSVPLITPTPTPKTEMISLMQQIAVTVTPQPRNQTTKTSKKPMKNTQVLGSETQNTNESDPQAIPTPTPQVKQILIKAFGMRNMLLFGASGVLLLLATLWWVFRLRLKK